jgi:glycerol uptake facilitator-like aquaporin
VTTVVGSGIMGERLAGGNVALALLGNTLPTGAILVVLILALGPISGAHFNPAVSLVMSLRKDHPWREFFPYAGAQIAGGCIGTLVAHGMFELPLLELAIKARTGPAQWFAEFVATFGLIVTILAVLRFKTEAIPVAVGLYITAAYWFTASTSFANPAVTIARALTNSFSGIAPADVPMFIVAQFVGALAGLGVMSWFFSASGAVGADLVRWALWSTSALLLATVSFAAGRFSSFRVLPEIVATLPGDESEFSREFDDRVRERFPIGSSEDKLLAFLTNENFFPDWRRRDNSNSSFFIQSGLVCQKIVRVFWRADAAGVLTDVRGTYESQCI